jgi:hypothetical protein
MDDDERARAHLKERQAQQYASTRRWSKSGDKLGMQGERALAEFFGAQPDLRNKPAGDDGIDLEILFDAHGNGKEEWVEADVKTAMKPLHLLVNRNKIVPHRIYVLAGPKGDDAAYLIGWEWGRAMMREPVAAWSGNDAIVHFKEQWRLLPLTDLKEGYRRWWRHHGLQPRPAKEEEIAAPPINPSFGGHCKCGAPGLYIAFGEWFCNDHRRY